MQVTFVIYTMHNCERCREREPMCDMIVSLLHEAGIRTTEVVYGNVDGDTYYPLPQHDQICRNPERADKYIAPVYLLEIEDDGQSVCVKLPDVAKYSSPESYVHYIHHVLNQA
jgi:hypothetical protein